MTRTVVCSAPGRVNLLGEHTDYNDGFALPIALEHRTQLRFTPDDGASVRVEAAGYGTTSIALDVQPGQVAGWAAYVAGAMWALRVGGCSVDGGRMQISSDVPVGAGLSSSAALQCAVIGALTAADGAVPERMDWARIAQRAENDFVGAPTGLLDQLASLNGRAGHALLIDFATLSVAPVPFDPSTTGHTLLVIDSHTAHGHAGGEYAERRASCERAAADLGVPNLRAVGEGHPDALLRGVSDPVDRRRARHVLTENARVLTACDALRRGDLAGMGRAMSASHHSMRDDFEITTPGIDLIMESAIRAGALGARMTGGGFGGCVIALVETDLVEALTATVTDVSVRAGHPSPTTFIARAGRGAAVDTAT